MTSSNSGGDGALFSLFLGVDLGGSMIRAGLVDAAGAVVRERDPVAASEQPGELFQQLLEAVGDLLSDETSRSAIAGVGVGIPGPIDPSSRRPISVPELPDLSGIDVYGELRRSTGLPVRIEEDAAAGAYGEFRFGAGRGSRSVLYVQIGTAVVAGMVLDGRIWRGANGLAGGIGSMTIDPNGMEGPSGIPGALDTVCSAPNIARRANERLHRDRTSSLSKLVIPRDRELAGSDIAKAAANGDDLAQLIMERTGKYLGIAIGGAISLLNVERVVLGGSVVASAGRCLIDPVIENARVRTAPAAFAACRILPAGLGERSVMIGAGLLARDEASA